MENAGVDRCSEWGHHAGEGPGGGGRGAAVGSLCEQPWPAPVRWGGLAQACVWSGVT